MDITNKLGRLWLLFLPMALLSIFFKYLHQLNAMLTSIEGLGLRKASIVIFLAFFALWSLVYLSSVFLVRAITWVWSGKVLSSIESPTVIVPKHPEQSSVVDVSGHNIKNKEELFRLDLKGESAA